MEGGLWRFVSLRQSLHPRPAARRARPDCGDRGFWQFRIAGLLRAARHGVNAVRAGLVAEVLQPVAQFTVTGRIAGAGQLVIAQTPHEAGVGDGVQRHFSGFVLTTADGGESRGIGARVRC